MPSQKAQFSIKGMSRDLADSKFNPEFAFENHNIRITPTDNSTLLVLSNEKGNAVINTGISYTRNNTTYYIVSERQVLGYAVLYKRIVLFQKMKFDGAPTDKPDFITKLEQTNIGGVEGWSEEILYNGNLNFNLSNPIETLPLYEAEDIQKVYWVDGINQPRVINIVEDTDHIIRDDDDTQFDFLPTLALNESITVERITSPAGRFPAGSLQYAITYSRKNGQESKIAWISNLYYTTFNDRAGAPNELTPGSYRITIDYQTVDTAFGTINIYSILRTSQDAGLQTKLIASLNINSSQTQNYVYIDTNNSGETIAATDLLYKGGDEITAETLATKDNTLFLGNIKYKGNSVPTTVEQDVQNCSVVESYSEITNWEEQAGYYSYHNPLLQNKVTYLKAGNKYRFGIQLQDSKGNWSEPLFIEDKTLINRPYINHTSHSLHLPEAQVALNNTFITDSIAAGYKKVRPVVVYPEPYERGVIAQGIVCPTVFRKDSRLANNPFAQSSWFFRPYNSNGYDGSALSKYSVEARHGHSLAPNNQYNAEVQNASNEGWATSSTSTKNYFVDGSILTFHSPDINDELIESDLTNSNINIVGAFAIDSVSGRLSLAAVPPIYTNRGCGIVSASLYNVNKSIGGSWQRNLFNIQTIWKDVVLLTLLSTPDVYYATYPWHKASLWVNKTGLGGDNNSEAANIISKIISNIRISQNFEYYSTVPTYTDRVIRDIRIFRAENGDSSYALKPASNPSTSCNFQNLYYKGTLSSQIIPTSDYRIYFATSFNGTPLQSTFFEPDSNPSNDQFKTSDPIQVAYRSKDHIVIALENDSLGRSVEMPTPYFSGDYSGDKTLSKYLGNLFWLSGNNSVYQASSGTVIVNEEDVPYYTEDFEGSDYVIRCTPSAGDDYPWTLTIWRYVAPAQEGDPWTWSAEYFYQNYDIADLSAATVAGYLELDPRVVWHTTDSGHTWVAEGPYDFNERISLPPNISTAASNGNEVMWITELTRAIPAGIFGGNSNYAIKNNKWYPCGEAIKLDANNTTLHITEGDTVFNRWDCLKTLPYTSEDSNQVVEIMSFMCESYVNTAGRYDKNKGLEDYTFLTDAVPFNQINPAYENMDDFFTYRITDLEKNKNTEYPTLVTWSLSKTLGEEIDSWTQILISSSLSMDGDRGKVRALRRFKNSIFAFQDKGIAEIIYNPTTAISTTQGVPIEIANSGKVEGKRYVSEDIGCTNKWSICTTAAGIYFIDSINKKAYQWSDGGMINLSEQFGFTSWFNNQITKVVEDWAPTNFNDIITQYDRTVGDVYFINKDNCLTFNESLGQFTSFYDYEKVPFFINLDNHCVAIKGNKLWDQHRGQYNIFFDDSAEPIAKPYSVEVVVNPSPTTDKIFNNIEFRADSWKGTTLQEDTFDYLETWNEYQHGSWDLTLTQDFPSTLKKKFRIWYANIPRDETKIRDRMRNTWLHLKLEKKHPSTERTVLHDLQVKYFM